MKYLYPIPLNAMFQVTTALDEDIYVETVNYDKALEVANQDNNQQLPTDVELSIKYDNEEVVGIFTDNVITSFGYVL